MSSKPKPDSKYLCGVQKTTARTISTMSDWVTWHQEVTSLSSDRRYHVCSLTYRHHSFIRKGTYVVFALCMELSWILYMARGRTDNTTRRLCCRGEPVFDGIQASIDQLPFPRPLFREMIRNLQVHPAITRTIGRHVPYFSVQRHQTGNNGGFKISMRYSL